MKTVPIIFTLSFFVVIGLWGCENLTQQPVETFVLEKEGFNSVTLDDAGVVDAYLSGEGVLPISEPPSCLSSDLLGKTYHSLLLFQFPDSPETYVEYGIVESMSENFCMIISVKTEGEYKLCIDASEWIGCGSIKFLVRKTYIDLRLDMGLHTVTLVSTLPETNFDNCKISISKEGEYKVSCWQGIP